jgi:hypothetical protein
VPGIALDARPALDAPFAAILASAAMGDRHRKNWLLLVAALDAGLLEQFAVLLLRHAFAALLDD